MTTPAARTVWRHQGWADLLGWITRRVPDCDPIVAGIHAARRAHLLGEEWSAVSQLASYLTRAAKRSPADRVSGLNLTAGTWEPAEPEAAVPPASMSLAGEAADLLRAVGLTPSSTAWAAISESLDVAVDWCDGFATSTGLAGEDLVVAARDAAGMSSEWRLRRHFESQAGRPLVALLLGGDQWGRRARRACGRESALLLWALDVRRCRRMDEPAPVPPAPVVRAWATTVGLIEASVTAGGASGHSPGRPTVAA